MTEGTGGPFLEASIKLTKYMKNCYQAVDKKLHKISAPEKRETHERSLCFLWPLAESQFPDWRSKES